MGNLARRVLTAVLLVPVAVAVIAWLQWPWVGVLFGLFVLAAAWEWSALAGWVQRPLWRAGFVLATLGALLLGAQAPGALVLGLAGLAVLGWMLALLVVLRCQRGMPMPPAWPAPAWLLLGWSLLVVPWLCLIELHRGSAQGPGLVLMLMALVWLADSGAYFAGRRFGRRKLAERISPGKTWEGVAGGLLVALVAALAYALLGYAGSVAPFMLLAAVTVLASVLGDLFESLVKRISGVKDSGSLLPGHGGVLDRVDSLTAAAPVYLVGLATIGAAGSPP